MKRDSESSKNEFNKFLLPKNDDNIINVPGQGPSFNTAIGKNLSFTFSMIFIIAINVVLSNKYVFEFTYISEI